MYNKASLTVRDRKVLSSVGWFGKYQCSLAHLCLLSPRVPQVVLLFKYKVFAGRYPLAEGSFLCHSWDPESCFHEAVTFGSAWASCLWSHCQSSSFQRSTRCLQGFAFKVQETGPQSSDQTQPPAIATVWMSSLEAVMKRSLWMHGLMVFGVSTMGKVYGKGSIYSNPRMA